MALTLAGKVQHGHGRESSHSLDVYKSLGVIALHRPTHTLSVWELFCDCRMLATETAPSAAVHVSGACGGGFTGFISVDLPSSRVAWFVISTFQVSNTITEPIK